MSPTPRRAMTAKAKETERGAHWTSRAACTDEDPELFTLAEYGAGWGSPINAEQEAEARAICARCPVVAECLAEGRLRGDKDTIRGGLTPPERDAINRKRRAS